MEVMVALLLFAIMAVGFTTSLRLIRENSIAIEEEMKITQILDSALRETLTQPLVEEGTTDKVISELGMELTTLIEPMELENEEGAILPQMYRVAISGRWVQDGQERLETVEGWRYLLRNQ